MDQQRSSSNLAICLKRIMFSGQPSITKATARPNTPASTNIFSRATPTNCNRIPSRTKVKMRIATQSSIQVVLIFRSTTKRTSRSLDVSSEPRGAT